MISDILLVNPQLEYDQQVYLLWRRHMRRGGWKFLDMEEPMPEEHEAVLFATGNQEEWLIHIGYFYHEEQIWVHQNEPHGRYTAKEEVVAWMRIATPENFKEFEAVAVNGFLSRVTAHVGYVS